MPRPIQAYIHLDACQHNLSVIRRQVSGAKIWSVIKANAYGHGIERALQGFAAADGFAMLDLDEAQRVRDAGWAGPILLLEGWFEPPDLDVVRALGLTVAVHDEAHVRMLADSPGAPIDVYVKLNTGMNRLGFKPDRAVPAWQSLRALPQVGAMTWMSHFANADLPGGLDEAAALFHAVTAAIQAPACMANSAAIMCAPQTHRDWVRPGIIQYGASPFADRSAATMGLRPTMSLRSRILAVQTLQPGECVGYGSAFRATRPTRIGVVACGYADGYPRHAPNGTPVWVDSADGGRVCPLVGRVSMDMLTVDITDALHANVDTTVELWGGRIPIDAVAQAAGTVGYELMCALARRVPVSARALAECA